ncbi:alpha/beta hydrolase family protein [Nocardioides sp. Soil805]|uniref:alpha/beta hydrolase family protein n=1 Tax=Nocardioides sp. Soil805 TaxID=1736416 RepID=UPI000A42A43F|nr:alpha/beta fold hydrolase [Nocardioides sp. Soil805]
MSSARDIHIEKRVAEVRVDHVTIGSATRAILVRPADHGRRDHRPGILWLHWLGHNRGDSGQFLPEAIGLAREGVVSLLPQGTFPWHSDPTGGSTDAARVLQQLHEVEHALAALRRLPDIDPGNVAVVGHDYGAMYALLLRDAAAKLLVAATPDADWATWFLTYWPLHPADRQSYARTLAGLSPLEAAASYGPRLFLQWAGKDEYVGDQVPALYANAAPKARAVTYDYDHQLGDTAITERVAALRAALIGGQQTAPAVAARR